MSRGLPRWHFEGHFHPHWRILELWNYGGTAALNITFSNELFVWQTGSSNCTVGLSMNKCCSKQNCRLCSTCTTELQFLKPEQSQCLLPFLASMYSCLRNRILKKQGTAALCHPVSHRLGLPGFGLMADGHYRSKQNCACQSMIMQITLAC